MPLRRALRLVTTYGDLAVYLWRRISASPEARSSADTANAARPSAQRPTVVAEPLTADEPRTAPTETVHFGMDGQNYEIDLTHDDEAELRKAFQRYIDAGRRTGPPARRPTTRKTKTPGTADRRPRNGQRTVDGHDAAAVRAWARAHGHEVHDFGRIPANVRQAYEADHHNGRARKR